LAELYLNGVVPVRPGKGRSAQEAADKAAFNMFIQAAKVGYAPAQYRVASMYADNRGVTQNMEEARIWLLKAGKGGYGRAQFTLGYAYNKDCCGDECERGSGCCYGFGKDYGQAKYWYERLSESEEINFRSMGHENLADLYEQGDGSGPDYVGVARVLESAAKEGTPSVLSRLAFVYFRGQGVPRDYEKAVSMLEELVERYGEKEHGYNLGVLYFYAPPGKEQTSRRKEAFRLFTDAAASGWVYAQSALGECYEYGVGVPRNYAEAARWYKLAAEQGFADAQFLLGELHRRGLGVRRDYKEALRLFAQASGRDLAWGHRGVAGAYYRGEGVTRDYNVAYDMYSLAAAGGDQESMYMLGVMYEQGQGLGGKGIIDTAIKWYREAADYPAYLAHYWDPDRVAEYSDKARAALRRLGE
jgi:hypothetical protein